MTKEYRELLELALIGAQVKACQVNFKIQEIETALSGKPAAETGPVMVDKPSKKKRKLSAAGRAAISAAGKRRWARAKRARKAA